MKESIKQSYLAASLLLGLSTVSYFMGKRCMYGADLSDMPLATAHALQTYPDKQWSMIFIIDCTQILLVLILLGFSFQPSAYVPWLSNLSERAVLLRRFLASLFIGAATLGLLILYGKHAEQAGSWHIAGSALLESSGAAWNALNWIGIVLLILAGLNLSYKGAALLLSKPT